MIRKYYEEVIRMRKICKECLKDQDPVVYGICPVELVPVGEVKICPVWTLEERRAYNERKTVQ